MEQRGINATCSKKFDDLYFISGNAIIDKPKYPQIFKFQNDSKINFDMLFFLRRLPFELHAQVSIARCVNLTKKPANVYILQKNQNICTVHISLHNSYAELSYIGPCSCISVASTKVDKFKYRNYLMISYSVPSSIEFMGNVRYPRDHPFIKVGQFLYRHSDSLFIQALRPFIFCERTLSNQIKLEFHLESLESFIANQKGHFKLGLYSDVYCSDLF